MVIRDASFRCVSGGPRAVSTPCAVAAKDIKGKDSTCFHYYIGDEDFLVKDDGPGVDLVQAQFGRGAITPCGPGPPTVFFTLLCGALPGPGPAPELVPRPISPWTWSN